MKFRIVLRDTRNSPFQSSLDRVTAELTCSIRNLDTSKKANIEVTIAKSSTNGELRLTYPIPFFHHEVNVNFQGNPIIGSGVKVKLKSVGEDIRCVQCNSYAVQARRMTVNGNSRHLIRVVTNPEYIGFCSSHISYASQESCSDIPQKCNESMKKKGR